ncbi:arginase family protein [uncultured Roseobacter sp.]|uniref:arginase family protein n=1 Tax=uncultured Roseobacter sp. TaxID=114847 RepID=UPI0026268A9F|nr:arginase family protein [uncultured Roseobacter sp.]
MDFYPPSNPNPLPPRSTEIATFMGTPFAQSLEDAGINMFGVPYDGASTIRTGTHHCTHGLHNQSSLMRAINHATRINPFEWAKIGDMGNAPFPHKFAVETTHDEIEAFAEKLPGSDILAIAIVGDHSVSLPLLSAIAKDVPVALICVDAHADTADSFQVSIFDHGAPFRRAVDEGLIDPTKTIQIGIRGTQNTAEGRSISESRGVRDKLREEFHERGPAAFAARVCALVGDMPVCLIYDIDSLDPVNAPVTGTPETGAITTDHALVLLRSLRDLNDVSADLVEAPPDFDAGDVTSLTGAALAYEILCLLAEARGKKGIMMTFETA